MEEGRLKGGDTVDVEDGEGGRGYVGCGEEGKERGYWMGK